MSWGGARQGAGKKPQYRTERQTTRQMQERWRLNRRWEEQIKYPDMQKIPLSVLDVPGSKLWFLPWMRTYLACFRKPKRFVEPFAGSGAIGLSLLSERRVGELVLVEKDAGYAAVWETLCGKSADYEWLLRAILEAPRRRVDIQTVLAAPATSTRHLALHTIIQSWCLHRGRRTSGKGLLPDTPRQPGGAALASNWRPQDVVRRTRVLRDLRRHLTAVFGCGLAYLDAHKDDPGTFFYCDPPYGSAGKRMYLHGAVDIAQLLRLQADAKAPVLVSFDWSAEVLESAANLGLEHLTVTMKSGQNRVMKELLLSNRPLPRLPFP
jgi:hypothetical protein